MARGPGKRFPKGVSGNPNGSSKRAKLKRELSLLSNAEMLELGSEILRGSYIDISNFAADSEGPALRMWMASLIKKGIEESDSQLFNSVMNRLLGKCPESKTITGPEGGPLVIQALDQTDEEKAERAERLRQMRVALEAEK